MSTFNNDEEIIDLVRRFESCEINPAEFRHYQHLTVALWYVREFPYDIATEKLCSGIKKLAAAYGKNGYHETITLFWLMVIRDFVANSNSIASVSDLANRLIASYSAKNLISEYYSADLLAAEQAKQGWVEPDLKRLSMATESIPSA